MNIKNPKINSHAGEENIDFLDDFEPNAPLANDVYPTADFLDGYEESGRKGHARAPRRRTGSLNKSEMDHIQSSLEESLSVYENKGSVSKGGPKEATSTAAAEGTANMSGRSVQARRPKSHMNMSVEKEPSYNETQKKNAMHKEQPKIEARYIERSQNEPEQEEPKKKKHHPILLTLILLLLCGIGFLGFKFVTRQSGYYTVAVFGVDSRNGNVGKEALSDVNIIARVDMESGEIKLVSLYRDTYSQISKDGKFHKFNEAYFRGGPEQAVWALENNTDVKVDDYATFNWKAVVDTINILGGVDLEITDAEFKYINAFITETVNSTGIGSYQLEHAGMNHLDGIQAVAYARLRLMDTDYQRTERQRKVIGLALEKARNADYATLYNILVTVMPQISTSVSIDDILPFAKNVKKYHIADTTGFPFDKAGKDIGKLDCVVPVTLESNAVKLHEFLYPDELYVPSPGLKKISNEIINASGLQ